MSETSSSAALPPVLERAINGNGTNGANGAHARGHIGNPEHASLLEEYYEQWKVDPELVDPTWRSFFEGFELGLQSLPAKKTAAAPAGKAVVSEPDSASRLKQARVYNLFFAYRTLGHRIANLDPLGFNKTTFPTSTSRTSASPTPTSTPSSTPAPSRAAASGPSARSSPS